MAKPNDQDVRKAFRTLHTFINDCSLLSKNTKTAYHYVLSETETTLMWRAAGEQELLKQYQGGAIISVLNSKD